MSVVVHNRGDQQREALQRLDARGDDLRRIQTSRQTLTPRSLVDCIAVSFRLKLFARQSDPTAQHSALSRAVVRNAVMPIRSCCRCHRLCGWNENAVPWNDVIVRMERCRCAMGRYLDCSIVQEQRSLPAQTGGKKVNKNSRGNQPQKKETFSPSSRRSARP